MTRSKPRSRKLSRRALKPSFVRSSLHFHLKPFDIERFLELATTMHELDRDKTKLASDPQNLNVIFKEMIQMCLWYVLRPATLPDPYWHCF